MRVNRSNIAVADPKPQMRNAEPEEDFETKMRREHAEHAKAMEKAAKPKTLNEMLDELDLEMAELD